MSLSNPLNPPILNEAVASPLATKAVFATDENSTKINQLHGIAPNNTTGAGIPKQVSNVRVTIGNAQTGATCTVSVLYSVDPTDSNFSGVNVWLRGYNGNAQLVQVASGTGSPCKFVLNNTGETVSFTVQAFGNGGNAPLSQSPTSSGTLPKSTTGGFGSSTVVSYNSSNPPPQTPSLPERFDYVFARGDGINSLPNNSFATFSASVSNFSPTATETSGRLFTGSGTASTNTTINVGYNYGANPGQGFCTTGSTKSFTMRAMTQTSSNVRYWIGFVDSSGGGMGGGINSIAFDVPNIKYVAFRFSAGTDSTWKLVAGTDNTHQTVADTGVAINTTVSALFQLVFNGNGTSVDGYINGVKVATVSSNLPAANYGFGECIVADNKNTATAVNLVFFWAQTIY
jgi:hypothetical protein